MTSSSRITIIQLIICTSSVIISLLWTTLVCCNLKTVISCLFSWKPPVNVHREILFLFTVLSVVEALSHIAVKTPQLRDNWSAMIHDAKQMQSKAGKKQQLWFDKWRFICLAVIANKNQIKSLFISYKDSNRFSYIIRRSFMRSICSKKYCHYSLCSLLWLWQLANINHSPINLNS